MVLFIMLYKVVLTFDSVDEILKCDHSCAKLTHPFAHKKYDQDTSPSAAPWPAVQVLASAVLCAVAVMSNVWA